MKFNIKNRFLVLLAAAGTLSTSACTQLAGTTLTFDEHGNAVVTPPTAPIVIPSK